MIKTIRIVADAAVGLYPGHAELRGHRGSPVPPVPAKPAANLSQAHVVATHMLCALPLFSPAEARVSPPPRLSESQPGRPGLPDY